MYGPKNSDTFGIKISEKLPGGGSILASASSIGSKN